MLKKADMKPGAVVEVLDRITDGITGQEKEYLGVFKTPGGFFDGGWKQFSGNQMEIIEGPKRRQGINTAKVKLKVIEAVGYVYWCELRASCKLVH